VIGGTLGKNNLFYHTIQAKYKNWNFKIYAHCRCMVQDGSSVEDSSSPKQEKFHIKNLFRLGCLNIVLHHIYRGVEAS
jgi:hypothetical protein